jgi:hypothetical protein
MAKFHRQRRVLTDFLVVVLGVLVALGLEHLLVEWRERQRVGDTLLAMHEEVSDFTTVFDVRRQAAPCITAKLDAIDGWLAEAGVAAPPVRHVGQPPFFFSSRGAWNAESAGLLARHRSPEVARVYGEVYQGVEEFAALAHREQAYWSRLQALQGQAGPLDAGLRWRAAEAAAGARNTGRLLAVIAEQMLERIETLVPGAGSSTSEVQLAQRPICLPLADGDGPTAPPQAERPTAP